MRKLNVDTIFLNYTFDDADGDAESGSLIQWLRYGVQISSLDNQTSVSPTFTQKGQIWNVTITPSDGTDYGQQENPKKRPTPRTKNKNAHRQMDTIEGWGGDERPLFKVSGEQFALGCGVLKVVQVEKKHSFGYLHVGCGTRHRHSRWLAAEKISAVL